MSVIWCANAIAHADKTKKGQKPTYPKGKRRIDHVLAVSLTDTFGISFKENDFLCTCCYESAIQSFTRVNPVAALTPINTNESRPARAAACAALSTISSVTDVIMSSDYEDSSSDISDDEILNVESQLNQQKSTELLNNIFALVGQPRIRDIRNRNILRQKVNDALCIIRQAAEQVYEDKEKEENLLIDDKPGITMDEASELINNFKHLINISDHSETIRLLTLVPKSWGRLKITNFFSCSEHQARYSIYLRDAGQILSLPIDLRGNIPFDPTVEKEIFDFFHTDEVSRVLYLKRI
jgi:hypothetical protein